MSKLYTLCLKLEEDYDRRHNYTFVPEERYSFADFFFFTLDYICAKLFSWTFAQKDKEKQGGKNRETN